MFFNNIVNSNIGMFNRSKIFNSKSVINSTAINRSVNNDLNSQSNQIRNRNTKDSITISAQGKKQSLVEQLMKQKQELIDKKNDLKYGLDENGNRKFDNERLSNYEEQIKVIEEQINQIQLKDSNNLNESNNKNNSNNNNIINSDKNSININKLQQSDEEKQNIENQNLAKISSIALSNEFVQKLSSMKNNLNGEANVLSNEINLDAARGIFSESKMSKLVDLKINSMKIMSDIGQTLNNTNNKLNYINQDNLYLYNSPKISNISIYEKFLEDNKDYFDKENLNSVGQTITPEMYRDFK